MRRIIHIDMDAFYASVEQRDDPALRGRPVVVGGSPQGRGVVAAASYEAREYGIHSAMPARRAARLCPELVFVRPDFDKYTAISREIREIFHRHTDLVEPLSLDEAYLDVTINKLGIELATDVAKALRRSIREELGLTASAGVAPVKFVAKIASDYRKPDGLTVVPPGRVLEFIHPLAVNQLWGVGPATARRLHRLGARTIGDLAALPRDDIIHALGRHGAFLHGLAHGKDPREVSPHRERKSRGAEQTFAEDIVEVDALVEVVEQQADRICEGLQAHGDRAHTVTVKVRYGDFTTITRSESLDLPTDDPELVMRVCRRLLAEKTEVGERPVRLIGVSLGNFEDGDTVQLELPFDE